MFANKTVIVVGAGASAEVGLPIGKDLRTKITGILKFERGVWNEVSRGDTVVFSALKEIAFQTSGEGVQEALNSYLSAASRICAALPQAISIDNFIDAHQGDTKLEKCGKLAIVRSILDAERRSKLYVDETQGIQALKFPSIESTWYSAFLQLLTENCRVDDVKERLSSIVFVIYNYDRCVEHFLYHALQNYYGITADVAAELIGQMHFYHPYGTVGNLPWHKSQNSIGYGGSPTSDKLVELAGQIKTFTEGTGTTSDISVIRNAMRESRTVLFLGFAFHPQNLKIIQPTDGKHLDKDVQYFGTAFRMSSWNTNVLKNELSSFGHLHLSRIELRADLTCYELFHEYWRSLALS